jgi:type 1 glutamine amidotransferase/nicotinamidase-related amidase
MDRTRRIDAPLSPLALASLALTLAWAAAPTRAPAGDEAQPDRLALVLRSRVESPGLGGACRVVETPASWDPKRTAAIVCDMWDLHHCLNAVRREAEMAPRMDQLLKALRDRGVLIVHAPSSCMDAYKDHPARRRARATPRSKSLPREIGQWCRQIPAEERGSYPVDQTDGGEDDDPAEHARWAARLASIGRDPRAPWKSETDALTIDPDRDLVSDDGAEIWSALEDRGVGNVILMGVHTNMCVLGRPFGLRQMAKNGKTVVLMRDLTDTMYNPARAPFVSHFTGTDRVVEHVERYVCPTVTSDQVLGGRPFRFSTDRRPRVAFLIAEDEYKTETTLPPFAAKWLGKGFAVSFVFDAPADKNALTGLGALDEADVLVVSARRRTFPSDQLAKVRKHVASGKAVVGIRTASHAFSLRGDAPVPDGHAVWPEFDAEVLGGQYTNHYKPGPLVAISPAGPPSSPILRGISAFGSDGPVASATGHGSLYKVSPLAPSATPLLIGRIPGEGPEPVAWTNLTATGGRVFYTSLGHPDDFADPAFQRLLGNAIWWAAGREVPEKVETASLDPIPFPK